MLHYTLPVSEAIQSGRWAPTFHRNMLTSYSSYKNGKTPISIYKPTCHYILEHHKFKSPHREH